MIFYALGFALLVGLAGGGLGVHWWHDSRNAARERDLAEAQAMVDELAAESQAQAAQSMEAERAAFIAGEANAKVVYRTIIEKGQQNVATYEVFRNPACVLPAHVLLELNGARKGIVVAAAAGRSDGPVPGAGTPAGRPDVNPVPANAQGLGGVSPVQAPTSNAGGDGQVSGGGQGRLRPKPQPIK